MNRLILRIHRKDLKDIATRRKARYYRRALQRIEYVGRYHIRRGRVVELTRAGIPSGSWLPLDSLMPNDLLLLQVMVVADKPTSELARKRCRIAIIAELEGCFCDLKHSQESPYWP